MALETMTPDPDWEPDDAERAAAEELARQAPSLEIKVWGGDWCGDCRAALPRFAAALAAVGIDPGEVQQFPVEKRADGTKVGPGVDEYDVTAIPTIVIERDETVHARFVESGADPAVVELVDQLRPRMDPT